MKSIPYKIEKFKESHINKIFESDDAFTNYWSKPSFSLYCSKKNRSFSFVATLEDDTVIGYVMAVYIVDFVQVDFIAVRSNYRSKGIAKMLMNRIVDCSIKERAQSIELEVSTKNEDAINLYSRFNFLKSGLRKSYYKDGSDALLLTRGIDNV